MRLKKMGQRVKILAGLPELVGKTGTIIDWEKYGYHEAVYYRVELDKPVTFSDVGVVTDDLWQGKYLRNIRS